MSIPKVSLETYFNGSDIIPSNVWGCVDEYWHYAVLHEDTFPAVVNPNFIDIDQGTCITYIPWLLYIKQGSPFSAIDKGTSKLSRHMGGIFSFDTITEDTMRDLLDSNFLFARKFKQQSMYELANGTFVSFVSAYSLNFNYEQNGTRSLSSFRRNLAEATDRITLKDYFTRYTKESTMDINKYLFLLLLAGVSIYCARNYFRRQYFKLL